jgi:CelD/BcsL family acetyltransferase involved in cellulose biosynthesis
MSIVTSFDSTGLDEQSWNALAARGSNSVFQTYQWIRSWWTAYGARYEPLLVTATHGAATGVAPMFVDALAGRGRVVRFMGDGRADYCDLLSADSPPLLAALLRGVRDYGRWDEIDLANVPAASTTPDLVTAACRDLGLHALIEDQFICPTLVIEGHEHAARRIVAKASLRRRRTYFEKQGRLSAVDLTRAADVAPRLDEFFAQHVARWHGTSTPSLFTDEVNRGFYRELTERLDGTGWLHYSMVQLDGKSVAIHYGFDYNGTLLWYKPSFDPAHAGGSPGIVLVQHLIQHAVDTGHREFDFTIGAEPFKWRFTNFARKTVRIRVFRDPARYYLERSKRGVVSAIKRAAARMRVL